MIIKQLNNDIETILNLSISEDDTIEMIKYKISKYLGCDFDDIYLFSQQQKQLNLHTIYEELIKKTDKVTLDDVENIMSDLSIETKLTAKKDKEYTYDDLLKLLDIKNNPIYFPIGHIVRVCANPFLCKKYLDFSIESYTATPGSLQKKLLLDYLPFVKDVLYVVQKKDVKKELQPCYFTVADLNEVKEKIETKEKFLLHQQPNKIKSTSIHNIKFTILPTHSIQLPLESIFNLFHASETYPMIHYYTGKTVIYKLYTYQKDVHNHKIPALPESVFFHTGDKDNKSRSVNVYLNDKRNSCVLFYEDGSITVQIKNKTMTEDKINHEIQLLLLPILAIVNEPVYQSGYTYPWSEKSDIFSSSNIKVDAMDYILNMDTNLLLHKKKINAVANVCLNIKDNFIYIYTSEYDTNILKDQVVKFLAHKLNNAEKVVKELKIIFDLNDNSAQELYNQYAPLEDTVASQINITVGFKVTFHSSPPMITIDGINNIHYLSAIKTNMNCVANILIKQLPIIKPVQIIEEEEEEEAFGGAVEEDDKQEQYFLKNPNFAVTRLRTKYSLEIPGSDYNKKCVRKFVPILISKKDWESEKYKKYRDRLDTMENGDKYVTIKDDHVLLCPKYWSFKQKKAYLHEDDLENRKKGDIFEFQKNSTKTRYDLEEIDTEGEYYEYPNYFHDSNLAKPAKYPSYVKGNPDIPCCGTILHTEKEKYNDKEKKGKELNTVQYIVGKIEPIVVEQDMLKYGYLPDALCDFFDLEKKVFRTSPKTDPHELLRCGIPNKNYQFLHTMYTIYTLTNKDQSITFDQYTKKMEKDFKYAQNGNIYNIYKSFKDFIKDSKNITHEEAWDLVSNLHQQNIIIFKDIDSDTEKKVELICPSNVYGKKIDDNQPCIILYYFEKDNCYEPIVKKSQNKPIEFVFNMNDEYLKPALDTIKETYKQCSPVIDYDIDNYKPTMNLSSEEMYNKLYDNYYDDIQQLSQNNKCIGFIIEQFFIPCYPSELMKDMDEIDTPPLNPVEDTIDFLNKIQKTFKLPCKPYYKVINKKNEITGILTETFHYVPCTLIKNNKKIKLNEYYGNLTHEFLQFKENTEDLKRIKNTKKVLYETYGFNYCKNHLMLALNLHEYAKSRSEIKTIIKSKKTYSEKLEQVNEKIHEILSKYLRNKIEWVTDIPDEYIEDMLTHCPNGFCHIQKMYLPKINLVTKESNDYYKRLADQLIRNKQVELFVLKPEIQFHVPYESQDQELILDSNIIRSYLDQLGKPTKKQKYYDNVKLLTSDNVLFKVNKMGKIIINE